MYPETTFHDGALCSPLLPAAESVGLSARKADDIYGTAPIIQDIWQSIWTAKVVIADVTGRNPNVNYELGLCHALGVPTVLITQRMEDVPFDYRHRRCIVYDTRRVDWQDKLRQDLVLTLKAVLEVTEVITDLSWPYDTRQLRYRRLAGAFVPADEAMDPILRGIGSVRESISRAFGPHGTSVAFASAFGVGKSNRAGVVIAAALESADALEQRGIDQVRGVTREVSAEIGDGTKASALLFCEMVAHGFDALRKGVVPRDLIHDMDVAVESTVKYLHLQSCPATSEEVSAVARTAAAGDQISAGVVVDAILKTGADGVVYVEDSPDLETTLEVREGMYFDRGFVTTRFINDEPKQLAVLKEA